MLLRRLVVVGLVGLASFASNIAIAEETAALHASVVGAHDVSFTDQTGGFGADRFSLALSTGQAGRFSGLAPVATRDSSTGERTYEVSLVARAGAGLDVAFAQRGGVSFNEIGDIARQNRGSELRLGRGLRNLARDRPSSTPKWYIFAGAEDEALIWRPGVRNDLGDWRPAFALQDRVEIGDRQAGLTYEHNGLQASFAYVEREISVRSGTRTFSQDEDFAGFTLTMRR